jgi:hypothetical protein
MKSYLRSTFNGFSGSALRCATTRGKISCLGVRNLQCHYSVLAEDLSSYMSQIWDLFRNGERRRGQVLRITDLAQGVRGASFTDKMWGNRDNHYINHEAREIGSFSQEIANHACPTFDHQ